MNYFIKKSHLNASLFMWALYGLIALPYVIYISKYQTFGMFDIYALLFFISLFILCMVCTKKVKNMGIYIRNDKIYSKGFFMEKEIDIETIAGIIIIKSMIYLKDFGYRNMKDNRGARLYSLVLLRDIKPKMMECKTGDICFCEEYKESVIAMCIYDIKLVDFLRKMNPNIEVL